MFTKILLILPQKILRNDTDIRNAIALGLDLKNISPTQNMYLTKEKLQHINTIAHEGKVVIVATDADGKIWYSVKQDGFEDSYLNTPPDQRTGWENWQQLELPNEDDDQSVIDQQTAELTD
ncbi:MAG: hypothetical protein ACRCT1_08180, partial [Microcoleaceae cyanobacterium]